MFSADLIVLLVDPIVELVELIMQLCNYTNCAIDSSFLPSFTYLEIAINQEVDIKIFFIFSKRIHQTFGHL